MRLRQFEELIPWLSLLNQQIIVNKDGSLLACLQVQGLNRHTETERKEAEARQHWCHTLQQLSAEPLRYYWRTHRSTYTPPSAPDTPAGWAQRHIHREWQHNINARPFFQSQHYLTLEYHPATHAQHRLLGRLRFFMQKQQLWQAITATIRSTLDPTAVFSYSPEELTYLAAQFEGLIQTIIGLNPYLHFERLTNHDGKLGQFLTRQVTLQQPQPFILPREGFFLDEFIAQHVLQVEHDHLQLSSTHSAAPTYISGLTIRFAHQGELPTHAPLLMHILDRYPADLHVLHTSHTLSQAESQRYLKQMYRYCHHREYSLRAYIAAVFNGGQFQEAMRHTAYHDRAVECEDILNQVMQNMMSLGWHNTTILLSASSVTRLRQQRTALIEHLHTAGVQCLLETEHLLSSYCLSLHHHRTCARWHLLSQHNITDYLTFTYQETGQPIAAYLSEQTQQYQPPLLITRQADHSPWYWDPHAEDNGHAFIIGPTGSGKSVLGNLIALQYLQYPGARVLIFDKDHSARIPILLQDGRYLSHTDFQQLNPCAHLQTHEEWVITWIATLLPDTYRFRQEDYQDLKQAIASTKQLPKHLWRIGSIVVQLANEPLQQALRPWTQGEQWGHYFDHAHDHVEHYWDASLLGLDVHQLLINPQVALPFMNYLMFQIECHLDQHTAPTLLYFSEIWQLMRIQRFQILLIDWLKRFRKKSASIIFDTQSFEDMEVSALFPTIRDNIRTRIYLPNPHLSGHLQQKLMDHYELTAEACHHIKQGKPKQDYFIHRSPCFHAIQLDLSPPALACLRSDQRAQHCFHQHYQTQHPQWKQAYIEDIITTYSDETHPTTA